MRIKSLRGVPWWILAAALLAACGGPTAPAMVPTAEGSPTSSCPSSRTITLSLATPQPADVLLELAWEGGFTRPELAFAFGRIPEFSLLPDGSVYYRDPSEWDLAQVMAAALTPAETDDLLQRVLDLGIERLESYTEQCQPQADGTCMCVADAGQSVLRVRLPGGELREVRNHADFANDPEALSAIRTLLAEYRHPQAQPYAPRKTSLFVRPVSPPSELPVLDWPLHPAWLAGGTTDASCVRALSGGDLQALLDVTGRNLGDFIIGDGGRVADVYLVPWLPGADYTDLIASSGQACPEEGGASPSTGELTSPSSQPPTPIPEFVGDEEYTVYRDLLLENEEMWNIPAGTENVVFFDRTFVRHDADDVRAILNGEAGVSEELVASFLEANSRSYPLEAKFGLGKPVVLVSQEAIGNLIEGLDYADQCYGAVWAVYPAPDYGGWFYVSRVGFDARARTALMYIEKSLCGGAGNFLVFENSSGVWKIIGWAIGLQSDMRLDSPLEVSDEEYAVYDAVLTASKEFSLASGYQYVTIYDKTGLSETLTREGEGLASALREEMPAVTEELVDNLIAANAGSYDLAPRFSFEVPVVQVSWEEYGTLSRELGVQECFEVVRERFPHPEFQGWFRLSRVGFSQSMDQALVYFESYVCNGAGFVALMEKEGGIWSMTANTLVWLS